MRFKRKTHKRWKLKNFVEQTKNLKHSWKNTWYHVIKSNACNFLQQYLQTNKPIEKLQLKGVKFYNGAYLLKFKLAQRKLIHEYWVPLNFTSVEIVSTIELIVWFDQNGATKFDLGKILGYPRMIRRNFYLKVEILIVEFHCKISLIQGWIPLCQGRGGSKIQLWVVLGTSEGL